MLVQIVGLSVVLVATLIILFVCISGNINLKMEVDKLKEMVGDLGYCDACFTGNYPMEVPDEDISHAFD